jgi:hypothetical protein
LVGDILGVDIAVDAEEAVDGVVRVDLVGGLGAGGGFADAVSC